MRTPAGLTLGFVISTLALTLVGVAHVHAQATTGPRLVITWRATDSAAPVSYPGKVLPGSGSLIAASVAVANHGNLADLSGRTIYWYLDGNLIGGGIGKRTITFTAPTFTEIALLRVQIPDYPTGALINTARVQIASPRVVIVSPYPGGSFSGSSLALQAVPYFFKASTLGNLVFRWTVNGLPVMAQENPQNLTVNLTGTTPSGYSLTANVGVQESNDPLTSAAASVTLNESN